MAKSRSALKIGFVLDGGLEKPDGVQQYILALGEYFKSQGHQVRYIVAGKIAPGITDAVSLVGNMPVISNGNRLAIPLPASHHRLRKYLADEKFDVLHIQTPYSPMMGGKLISLAGDDVAVVGTFHVLPSHWFFWVGNWALGIVQRMTLRRFDKMLSVSSAAQEFCKKTFHLDSDISPNVVDYKRFNTAKPFAKYKDGKLTILFVGRLVPRKGCQVLLEAVNEIKSAKLPGFRVVVCGDGPLRKSLEDYVAANGLNDMVEFVGFISEEDKPRYYASADLAVFPASGGESFGIVLIEALSTGRTAVLAGNNPGYATVMAPRPELLFDPKSVEELASKLKTYLKDEDLRRAASAWGGSYAHEFDCAVVGEQLLDIFEAALITRRNQ